jgi:hypothetical protein
VSKREASASLFYWRRTRGSKFKTSKKKELPRFQLFFGLGDASGNLIRLVEMSVAAEPSRGLDTT